MNLASSFEGADRKGGVKAYKLRSIEKSRRTAMEQTRQQTQRYKKATTGQMDRIENKMAETWIADLTEAQLFQNTRKARRQAARKYSQQKDYKKFTKHYTGDKSRSYKVNSKRLERIEEQEELIEDIQPNLQQLDNQQIVENNSQSLEDIINNAANELEINNKKRGYKPKKR